ncbi:MULTISPECIES: site-2 protease family protein [unclassified Sphingomonas]|jgi:Zn-dependent protease|uniref:site-2 protease family protein n=1 Tax=unclassified Sphingomonas TaxID=196159 RepID=UPI000E1006FA|nr:MULTISPECIES: site-2 protease family protein [unclassified Sphingomonas]AXJ94544.1 site-2 protease family protein [Sphingomonas sp. FARSPH]
MNSESIVWRTAVWIIPLVVAIVFHEVAHGWMAKWLGDPTAAERRRLSFNPVRHIDPVGTVILPLGLAIAGAPVFGWAKPVPVVAERLHNPRWGMVAVALAGPGMNLALALLTAIALGIAGLTTHGIQPASIAAFIVDNLFNFLVVNVFLALFNLLPIPPFDGSHVVEGVLPRPLAARYARIGQFGMLLLIGLIVVLPMLSPRLDIVGRLVAPPAQMVISWFLHLAAAIGG